MSNFLTSLDLFPTVKHTVDSRVVRAVDKTVELVGLCFGEARQKCHLSYSV